MKKQEQQTHELYEFPDHCHLFNIFGGGSGKGLGLLRKILDSIQNDNYSDPGNKLPSLLITGPSKGIFARAFINSLQITDIRECPGDYFDNGTASLQFFEESLINTAHLITNIERLTKFGQSVIWKYLKKGKCEH